MDKGANVAEADFVRVDLGECLHEAGVTLSGEIAGNRAREFFGLDSLDRGQMPVKIVIPLRVVTVTSSFLRSFIRPSIILLGIDGFKARYSFAGKDISEDIAEETRRASIELARVSARSEN